MPDIAVVLDCGATNATVVAVDDQGKIAARASRHNAPVPQPGGKKGWLIWDLEEIWGKLCQACQEVCQQISPQAIKAVTVTTFGADGTTIRKDGTLTYPLISWQCSRTEEQAAEIARLIDPWETFAETGYQIIPFNTLLKLMWLKRHAPQAMDEADYFLMTPGLLTHKLCGEFSIDPTIASTAMAMDLGKRDWSPKMLELAEAPSSLFPRWAEPGEVVGKVHARASRETRIPEGTPVVAGGHDTQFAAIGSGARLEEAILSSGTWEILMVRADSFRPTRLGFEEGLIIEADTQPGFWNPQMLMMASGVLEWVQKHFYAGISGSKPAYDHMIAEAAQVEPGSGGVTVIPSFVPATGPTKKYGTHGTILGLELTTSRAQIYRAALEGLCFQLRSALDIMARAVGFEAQGIRVVGGGSKNPLWNQLRADITGLPVTTIAQEEATVLGAALFALVGAGKFSSLKQALKGTKIRDKTFEPARDREVYDQLFEAYAKIPGVLRQFYQE